MAIIGGIPHFQTYPGDDSDIVFTQKHDSAYRQLLTCLREVDEVIHLNHKNLNMFFRRGNPERWLFFVYFPEKNIQGTPGSSSQAYNIKIREYTIKIRQADCGQLNVFQIRPLLEARCPQSLCCSKAPVRLRPGVAPKPFGSQLETSNNLSHNRDFLVFHPNFVMGFFLGVTFLDISPKNVEKTPVKQTSFNSSETLARNMGTSRASAWDPHGRGSPQPRAPNL